jgi:hypothetical protein
MIRWTFWVSTGGFSFVNMYSLYKMLREDGLTPVEIKEIFKGLAAFDRYGRPLWKTPDDAVRAAGGVMWLEEYKGQPLTIVWPGGARGGVGGGIVRRHGGWLII